MMLNKIAVVLFLFIPISLFGKTIILLTAALADNGYYELRKQQYIRCLMILAEWGYIDNVYMVESLAKEGPTFLDDYCNHVFYATVNDPTLKNMGINEAKTTLEAINHFGFDDNDMIIKLTGRYEFVDKEFIQLVQKNEASSDLIGKFSQGAVYTLCYAMRCKYLREMLESIDYESMEHGGPREHNFIITIEVKFGEYVKQKRKKMGRRFRITQVDRLGVKAILTGSTSMPIGTDGITITI